MPFCSSGRHFHVDIRTAAHCCSMFKPTREKADLLKEKADHEEKLAGFAQAIEKQGGKIKNLDQTLRTLEGELQSLRALRLQKLVKGELPAMDVALATLPSDIEGLKKVISEHHVQLNVLSSQKGDLVTRISRVETELSRIERHEKLKEIHAKMLSLVSGWNECVGQVFALRKEAGDTASGSNNGEYPLLPAELSPEIQEENRKIKILGMIPWGDLKGF